MEVVNTNTRYLYPGLTDYARRLVRREREREREREGGREGDSRHGLYLVFYLCVYL